MGLFDNNEVRELKFQNRELESQVKTLQSMLDNAMMQCGELSIKYQSMSEAAARWKHTAELAKEELSRARYNSSASFRVSVNGEPQFSQEDIKRLLRLCHPDRHDNSDAANEMTKKLLSMRGRA